MELPVYHPFPEWFSFDYLVTASAYDYVKLASLLAFSLIFIFWSLNMLIVLFISKPKYVILFTAFIPEFSFISLFSLAFLYTIILLFSLFMCSLNFSLVSINIFRFFSALKTLSAISILSSAKKIEFILMLSIS
ncbi:unnamed protein product [Meganyctiphanes norvegica]|uniref:Uncharacterized protein n=1 Tax=Meganyctiphanes norvegica TaxID=48144 RepID=A0AAV2SF17_MEGNR